MSNAAECDFNKDNNCTLVLCAFWTDSATIMIGSSVSADGLVYVNVYSPQGMGSFDYRISEIHVAASNSDFNSVINEYNNSIPSVYYYSNKILDFENYLKDTIYNLNNGFSNCNYDKNKYYHCVESENSSKYSGSNIVGYNASLGGINATYLPFSKSELFGGANSSLNTFTVCVKLPNNKSYCANFSKNSHPMIYKYIIYR